jgi:hypothetical protein
MLAETALECMLAKTVAALPAAAAAAPSYSAIAYVGN